MFVEFFPIAASTNRKYLFSYRNEIIVKLWKRKIGKTEAVVRRCSAKKVFLEISQNSQENTCARIFFLIKLKASSLQLYFKKRLWHRCFSVNCAKFLKAPFFIEHLQKTASQRGVFRTVLNISGVLFSKTVNDF